MAKANAVVQVTQENGNITFTVNGAGSVTLNTEKMSAANRAYAMFHGLKQRGVDAAALSRDTTTGKPATPAEKLAAIQSIVEHLESGSDEWSRIGQGGGGKSLTVEAIASVKGWEYDQAEAYVADYAKEKFEGDTKKCLAFLRTGERVAAAMEAIRKARMPAPKVDADAALDALTKG